MEYVKNQERIMMVHRSTNRPKAHIERERGTERERERKQERKREEGRTSERQVKPPLPERRPR